MNFSGITFCMEKWDAGIYYFVSCKDCNFVVSFDSKQKNNLMHFYFFLPLTFKNNFQYTIFL